MNCAFCSQHFDVPKNTYRKYCSPKCYRDFQRKQRERIKETQGKRPFNSFL